MKKYFGCRIHFKNGGTDKVVYHNTIEESDAFFAEKVREFKVVLSVGELPREDAGYYEDYYVVISKEDVEFPEASEASEAPITFKVVTKDQYKDI